MCQRFSWLWWLWLSYSRSSLCKLFWTECSSSKSMNDYWVKCFSWWQLVHNSDSLITIQSSHIPYVSIAKSNRFLTHILLSFGRCDWSATPKSPINLDIWWAGNAYHTWTHHWERHLVILSLYVCLYQTTSYLFKWILEYFKLSWKLLPQNYNSPRRSHQVVHLS